MSHTMSHIAHKNLYNYSCKIKGINELEARESKIYFFDYAHYNSID